MADQLTPYLSDLHRSWLSDGAAASWRVIDASLVCFDISGFTPLTERLARRGRAGVERLVDTLNAVVAPLVGVAGALGGDTLKLAGDALLVLFDGGGHERRAAAAAWEMQRAMSPFARMRTAAGVVSLRASAAVASGPLHVFLVGDRFRELVVGGPVTSAVMRLEGDARSDEVLLSAATAAQLDAVQLDGARAGARRLAGRPEIDAPPRARRRAAARNAPLRGLPAALHDHLGMAAESEHRQVTAAFAQFRGLDDLILRGGPAAAARELEVLMERAQGACERHGVTLLATDADLDAGRLFLVTGAPTASTDDEDRMLLALREIVAHDGDLRVRAGVDRGRAFVVHLGALERRTYTAMGDTTNLAARVTGNAPDGAVLATRAVLSAGRAPFALTAVAPFAVKGKHEPVDAELVGEPLALAPRVVADIPLSGREIELGALREAIGAARGGNGRLVELVGEAGIGKSRLLVEIANEAGGHGLRRVLVEAGAYATAAPYFAVREPLRALVRGAAGEADAALALAACVREHVPDAESLLPLLAIPLGLELPATEASGRLSSELGRAQLHFLFDRLLGALLPAGATLICVEDAHWLDEASSDLLTAVLRRTAERGWAVVVTSRPDRTSGLRTLPVVHTRIELEPLAADAARSLVGSASAGGGALAPHVTAALVERAHGNPLFLRELGAAARAGADLDELPDTVEALLTSRIDTLPPADRRLLRRAAVLGARFPIGWLSGMLDIGEHALRGALEPLRDFLAVDGERVRFHHALQREAAYATLPFELRRRLHARAGELIERERGVGADEVADILGLHFLRARDFVRAYSYARAAADAARDTFAYADAAQLYRRALEAARALHLPAPELADLWEQLGEAHARTGEPAAAEAALTRARRLIRGDPLHEARLLDRHGEIACDAGHVGRAVRWLLRGLRMIEPEVGRVARARRAHLTVTLAVARFRQGRTEASTALCLRAIDEAEAAGEDSALARACYMLDVALFRSGRAAEAVYSPRALEIYERQEDLRRKSAVLNNLGALAYWDGRWGDALELYREAATTSARAGGVADAAFGDCNIGEVRSDQGRFDEAEACLRRALDTWRATGDDHGVATAISLLGRLAGRAGRGDEGAALLSEAVSRFRALRLSHDVLVGQVLQLENLAYRGHAQRALAGANRFVEDLAGGGLLSSLLQRVRCFALAQLGDVDGARAAAMESLAAARRYSEDYEVVLGLDALIALGADDPTYLQERTAIRSQLDIVRLPPTPVRPAPAPHPAFEA